MLCVGLNVDWYAAHLHSAGCTSAFARATDTKRTSAHYIYECVWCIWIRANPKDMSANCDFCMVELHSIRSVVIALYICDSSKRQRQQPITPYLIALHIEYISICVLSLSLSAQRDDFSSSIAGWLRSFFFIVCCFLFNVTERDRMLVDSSATKQMHNECVCTYPACTQVMWETHTYLWMQHFFCRFAVQCIRIWVKVIYWLDVIGCRYDDVLCFRVKLWLDESTTWNIIWCCRKQPCTSTTKALIPAQFCFIKIPV